mgnify:CR=1 FL=1
MTTIPRSSLCLALGLTLFGSLACGSEAPEPTCPAGCSAGCDADGRCRSDSEDAGSADLGATDAGAADLGPEDLGPADLGPADLGPEDLGPADQGVPPVMACGSPGPGLCTEPADCGRERPGPTNCPFCPPDHTQLCLSGTCETPPLLEPADVQEVAFTVEGAFASQLRTLVGVVIAQETPSGARLDCDEVTRPDFDLAGECYNVLTSRAIRIFQTGTSYTFQYGTFSAGLPVLLLVYGFDQDRPDGAPLGVSCTPHAPGGPGSGRVTVPGQPMLPADVD